MPVLNLRLQGRTDKGSPLPGHVTLQRFGPRVGIQVGIHPAVAKKLTSEERPIPPAEQGYALVDTGASRTSIDLTVAAKLELAQTGNVKLGTAGGPKDAPTFAFSFALPILLPFELTDGIGCDLGGQGIIALIGMDLLSKCVFIMNGPDGSFTISI